MGKLKDIVIMLGLNDIAAVPLSVPQWRRRYLEALRRTPTTRDILQAIRKD